MFFVFKNNLPKKITKIFKNEFNFIQVANITGRGTRGGPLKLQKPFPYENKNFMAWHRLKDNTMIRISEENAKIILVEGPIGVGKTAFAKALAEELDMKHVPEANMDELYVFPSGYDFRQHDPELPKCAQSYDHKNFCVSPKDYRAGKFQINMLRIRFSQYFDAITHLLNTGQGVVLERSFWSDYAFIRAMYSQNFISKEAKDMYDFVRYNTKVFLKPPHLVIYLDIPVPVVQERIRTRNYSYEQNSPALTKEYLEVLEKTWKEDYLKNVSQYSEVLVYDWTDGGDVELIVEDIEKLDFDVLRTDNKFKFWKVGRKDLNQWRYLYTNNKIYCMSFFKYPYWKVPEWDLPLALLVAGGNIKNKIPECQYAPGYNPLMGDSFWKILFSVKGYDYRKFNPHFNYGSEIL